MRTSSGEGVPESSLTYGVTEVYDPDEAETEYIDEDVIYLGFLWPGYGHALMDSMKQAWFPFSEQGKQFAGRKLVYIVADRMTGYLREMFSLAGINLDDCLWVKKPTRFRSVLVPDPSRYYVLGAEFSTHAYTKEYCDTIERMIAEALRRRPVKHIDKLYFARTTRVERRSRKLIEGPIREGGFTVVVPDKLSVAEQISMLQGCKVFMATDGSLAHNAVFLPEGTELVLLRKCFEINPYSTQIIEQRKLRATIIDCHLSTIGKGYKPFFYYANKLLCDYLGIRRKPFPFGTFSRYWRHLCIYPDIADRLLLPEDYRNILQDEIMYYEQTLEAKLKKWIPIKGAKGEKIRKMAMYAVMYLKLM